MVPRGPRRRSSASSTSLGTALNDGRAGAENGGLGRVPDRESEDESDEDEGKIRRDPHFEEVETLNGSANGHVKVKTTLKDERWKWWKVYAMHFLFMWNSRTYEYVSVSRVYQKLLNLSNDTLIFLVALAFPEGLTATSIRGIASTLSGLLCASAVGSWIDRAPSRLPTLLITISSNHGAIILSYICWLFWPLVAGYGAGDPTHTQTPLSNLSKGFLFGAIVLLDVIHDLSAIANRLSVERDWVPVLVGPITTDITYGLTQVNSVMVRIDLLCKLVAPSLLPVVMSSFNSREAWILLLAGMAVVLWGVEVWCARIIARDNPELRQPKKASHDPATIEDHEIDDQYKLLKPGFQSWPRRMYFVCYQDPVVRLKHYFSMPMWPASISMSLLQLTVLAYSATLITYLLEIGFSLSSITVAQASGAILALSSTVITPWAVSFLRKRYNRRSIRTDRRNDQEDDGNEGTIVRTVGLWGISSQFLSLVPVVLVLWNLSPKKSVETSTSVDSNAKSDTSIPPPHIIISIILFSFLSLSRVGHYMNHLMVQELEQVEIPVSQRSTFAGTEQSFRSFCELCHWAATVVWSRPEDFRWLALGSLLVTGISAGTYVAWMRRPRLRMAEEGYEGIAMEDVHRDNE